MKHTLAAALEDGTVVTVAPVLAELLSGLDSRDHAAAQVIERLHALEMLDLPWDVCVNAGGLGHRLSRRGIRVPTVDLLISAAADFGGHEVWHAGDKHFAAIERAGGPHQRDLTKASTGL